MRKEYLYYIIITLVVFIISGSSFLLNKWIIFGLTSLLFFLFLSERKQFSRQLLIALVVWMVINILSTIFTESDFVILRMLNYTFNLILLPYFLISLMGLGFWFRLERIVFFLTLISLPLFLLNVLFPDVFDSLSNFFRPLTRSVFYRYNPNTTYWSSLIYVNAIKGVDYNLYRNCGFMWEPGSFAMIIIWAIVFNRLTQGHFVFKKFAVYFIALITTLSTAGYLAIFVVILSFFLKKTNIKTIILIAIFSALFWTYIYQLDFVGGKIEYYIEGYQEDRASYHHDYEAYKVSRFQIVKYDFFKALEYPLGYGVISKKDFEEAPEIVGVNGLSNLMVMWGIPVFLYMLFLIKRYVFMLNFAKHNDKVLYILYASLLIVFFSNPLKRNIFIYLIFFTPFILRKTKEYFDKR
ncbi:MAG: hypothetical protein ACOCWG_01165 [bacterium]